MVPTPGTQWGRGHVVSSRCGAEIGPDLEGREEIETGSAVHEACAGHNGTVLRP